jgi:hypothetical protein
MDHDKTFETLIVQIGKIEAIDAHTHINSSHMAARGLHDIILDIETHCRYYRIA